MPPQLIGLLVIVAIPVLYVIITYNRLVSLKNQIRNAWSNVDTELKRRYDLIPNLVATVQGYAQHEREVLQRVTELRGRCMASNGRPAEQAVDENQLVDALKQMMVVVEAYPTLKADQNFLQLQQELVNTEDRIQAARRFFNGNIRDYLTLSQTFPSVLVAKGFRFEPEEYFTVEPVVRTAPGVSG